VKGLLLLLAWLMPLCTWILVLALKQLGNRVVEAIRSSSHRLPTVLDAITLAKAQAMHRRSMQMGEDGE